MKNGALVLTDGEFWKVKCGARWHIALDSGAPLAADNFQPPNFSKTSQKCPFSRSPRFARLFRTQANFVLCLACDYRTQANLLLRLACDFERKPICFLAWLAFNRGQAERAAQASKIGLLSADLWQGSVFGSGHPNPDRAVRVRFFWVGLRDRDETFDGTKADLSFKLIKQAHNLCLHD